MRGQHHRSPHLLSNCCVRLSAHRNRLGRSCQLHAVLVRVGDRETVRTRPVRSFGQTEIETKPNQFALYAIEFIQILAQIQVDDRQRTVIRTRPRRFPQILLLRCVTGRKVILGLFKMNPHDVV